MIKKNKYSFPDLNLSWLPVFGIGFFLGITSQYIPSFQTESNCIVEKCIVEKAESRIDSCSIPQQSNRCCSANYQPISFFYVNRTGYSLVYDASHRNPQWVYECLTAENLQGEACRSEFKEDDGLPRHLIATCNDYKGSGFDRGHMAPAADHRSSSAAMSDTFYITNMCPQCPELNRGYWAKLEKHVRDLTSQYSCVHVITGPLYLAHMECDGKKYIKYQVIGKNDIAVPTHFFKVICVEDELGDRKIEAFIVPNEPIPSCLAFDHFKTSPERIEQAAGLILFSEKS